MLTQRGLQAIAYHISIYLAFQKKVSLTAPKKVSKPDEIRDLADPKINNSGNITPDFGITSPIFDHLIPETDTLIQHQEKYQNAQNPLPDLKVGGFC